MGLVDQVEALLAALRHDAGADCPARRLVGLVLCDRDGFDADDARLLKRRHGIACVPLKLRGEANPNTYDPQKVADALVSLT
jgi:hypothetical protein